MICAAGFAGRMFYLPTRVHETPLGAASARLWVKNDVTVTRFSMGYF